MNDYSRKMVRVPTVNLLREQDIDKLPVLDVRNLGIDFGGLTAVDGFNITIGPTEISGLIGPNGAGKTTIFNLLTGVYQPTRGSVLVNGIDIKGMPIHKVNKLGIARTFQNIRLFTDMTALDNVKVGMHNEIKCSFLASLLLGVTRFGRVHVTVISTVLSLVILPVVFLLVWGICKIGGDAWKE